MRVGGGGSNNDSFKQAVSPEVEHYVYTPTTLPQNIPFLCGCYEDLDCILSSLPVRISLRFRPSILQSALSVILNAYLIRSCITFRILIFDLFWPPSPLNNAL